MLSQFLPLLYLPEQGVQLLGVLPELSVQVLPVPLLLQHPLDSVLLVWPQSGDQARVL